MITFYQSEWCPSCHTIRQLMTELGITYLNVNVAADPDARADVMSVSGQSSVPVLQDGDKVFTETSDIVAYLRATYPEPADAELHAGKGAWRTAGVLSLPPRAALARLRELLDEKGFQIITQVRGPKISEALPKEYVLLQVSVPAAAAKAIETDPLAPAAVMFPMALMPAEGGGTIIATADPVGTVWLYSEPPLNKIQAVVKKRLSEVLSEI
jgi:glutathione S-transferase